MRLWNGFLACALAAGLSGCGGSGGGGGGADGGGVGGPDTAFFTHTATVFNIAANATIFDHPALNDNPSAAPLVTQNWNPGGGIGVYNNHPIAVYYNGTKWGVFNQDGALMPAGAHFNVALPTGAGVFVHTATALNTTGGYTKFDSPHCNGNPSAVLRVTAYWNGAGALNPHPVAVFYHEARWYVGNLDRAALPLTAGFLVAVSTGNPMEFVQTSTPANVAGNGTIIYDARINGDAFANLQVTQVEHGTDDINEIGVYYDGANWVVFNESGAVMPLGAAFFVRIEP